MHLRGTTKHENSSFPSPRWGEGEGEGEGVTLIYVLIKEKGQSMFDSKGFVKNKKMFR